MPRIQNPYQAQTPIGQAIANFGGALFGGPTKTEAEASALKNQLVRAQIAEQQREAEEAAAMNAARSGMRQFFERAPMQPAPAVAEAPAAGAPGFIGPAQAPQQPGDMAAYYDTMASGLAPHAVALADNPGDIANLMRFFAANTPGIDDERVARSVVGSGDLIGEDQAVSLADRERVRQANLEAEMAAEAAKRPTFSQARAGAFNELPGDQQAVAVGPTFSQVRGGAAQNAIRAARGGPEIPTDERTIAMGSQAFGGPLERVASEDSPTGVVLTPRQDAAGQPGIAPAASSREDVTGVSTTMQNRESEKLANISSTRQMIDAVRKIAREDPTNFGAAGWAKKTVQNAAQQGSAFSQFLAEEGYDVGAKVQADNTSIELNGEQPLSPALFDPNLPQLEFYNNLLTYRLALINNPDGRISTPDYENAKRNMASLGLFSLSNQAEYLNRLSAFERFIDMEEQTAQQTLRGNFSPQAFQSGGQGVQGDTQNATDMSNDELIRGLGIQ